MSHWINYKTDFKDTILFEHWNKQSLIKEIRYYLSKIYFNDDFKREYKKVVDNIKMYTGDVLCK